MTSSSPSGSVIEFGQKTATSQGNTHAASLAKLADGIMNRGWNTRYFLLRGSTLQYFANSRESRPREIIDLLNAEVTWLGEYFGRPFCIGIEPSAHRPLHIAGSTLEEAKQWMRWLQEAADPTAYSGLPQALGNFSPSSLRDMTSHVSDFTVPPEIPLSSVEAGKALEKIVACIEMGKRGSSLTLVEVVDGARVFTSSDSTGNYKPNHTIVYALLGLLVGVSVRSLFVPAILFTVFAIILHRMITGFSFTRSNEPSTAAGTVSVQISTGGCKNWVLDACRYPLWMPKVSSAFTTPVDSVHDCVHYILSEKSHLTFKRFRWELDDGSVCFVSSEGHAFEGWFFRRLGVDETRVFFVSSGFGQTSASSRVKAALSGLLQLSLQVGDHDGAGIPRPIPGGWIRHFKGGLVPTTHGSTDTASIARNLFRSMLLGRRKIAIKSLFPATGKSPLKSLPWLFSGLSDSGVSGARALSVSLVNSLAKTAAALAETAFTTHHPKMGETALCWIGTGEKAPQIFLEATETSRPSIGIAASVRVTITAHNWSAKGFIKYKVVVDDSRGYKAVRVQFGESLIEIAASKAAMTVTFPDLIIGPSPSNRVFWEGALRISEEAPSRTTSIVLQIPESGYITGSVLDGNGRKLHGVDGHWLETLYIDTELMWTHGVSPAPAHILFKKAEDEERVDDTKTMAKAVPRMSSADEDAQLFINRLKQEIVELKKFSARIDDGYLYRFSKARQFVFDETKQMLLKHVAWLEENKVPELLSFEFPELPDVKAAFPHGYHGVDKHGRPIYISRLAKTDQERLFQVTNWDRFLKFWTQSYEELLFKKIPACTKNGGRNPQIPGLSPPSVLAPLQTLTILDLKGVGLGHVNMKVKEFIERSNAVSSLNYPEILGAMYIVNAPGVFPLIWNAVKGMIDPGTRSKMHVLTAKQTREKLLEVIDADQLPFFLGGNCKCDASLSEADDSDCGCLSSDKGPWLQDQ